MVSQDKVWEGGGEREEGRERRGEEGGERREGEGRGGGEGREGREDKGEKKGREKKGGEWREVNVHVRGRQKLALKMSNCKPLISKWEKLENWTD